MKYERAIEILRVPNNEYLRASEQLSSALKEFTHKQRPDWQRLQKTVLKKWGDHPEIKFLVGELGVWPVAPNIDHDYLFVDLITGNMIDLDRKTKIPASQEEILTFAGNSMQLNATYYQRMFQGPWGETCQAILEYRKRAALHSTPPKSPSLGLIETFLVGRLAEYGPLSLDQYAPQLARMAGKIFYLMGYITNPDYLDEKSVYHVANILEANGVLCTEDNKLSPSPQ